MKKWCLAGFALAVAGSAFAVIPPGGGGSLPGRMTGGGSIINNGIRVTHGFELNCDSTQVPQSLEINWDTGNHFHLEQLTSAFCSNDPSFSSGYPNSDFNTYKGSGTGSFNGVDGATVSFVFTDAGEPGVHDLAVYTITDGNGNVVLTASGTLDNGNHQAH